MASIKFSAFTNEAVDAATTQLVGYKVGDTSANYRYSVAQLATALSPSISTFYTADGAIGASRVATITDFPKFSGTQGNPIGLEIENTETSAGAHSTLGAQLKLTSNSASSTISLYNGLGGGSSAPAMIVDSPVGIQYSAGSSYQGYHHRFTGSTWVVGMTDSPIYSSSPRLRMYLGGGGGNGSFITTEVGGSSDYLYMFMSPGTAARHIALGEYTNSTTTYKDFIRINSTGDVGINQDTPVEKLHVTGNVKIDGQAYTELHTEASAATITPDWDNGNIYTTELTSASTTFADPTNIKPGATYIIILKQDGTGSRTVSWGTKYKFPGGTAPTLTTGANKADVITLVAYSTDILMCTSVLDFVTS